MVDVPAILDSFRQAASSDEMILVPLNPVELIEVFERCIRAEAKVSELLVRLALTPEERAVLDGRGDGCVRVGDLRPIARRVFGDDGDLGLRVQEPEV